MCSVMFPELPEKQKNIKIHYIGIDISLYKCYIVRRGKDYVFFVQTTMEIINRPGDDQKSPYAGNRHFKIHD